MDLVPKPDQLVAAAGNVAHRVLRGGIADLRPMPRTLVGEGEHREVYHYRSASVHSEGDPVLLVASLAAPSLCFDLRRGCSLVETLVGAGRPTYVVEYGEVAFHDRSLDLARWVDDVVPAAIREASLHAGGKPVHLVGWSLGGIFALLCATDPSLPIASVSVVSTPGDVAQVPLVAPMRPLLDPAEIRGLVGRAYRTIGALPAPLLRWTVGQSLFQNLVTKPLALAARLDDRDFLAQVDAVDRLAVQMAAYPGRSYGQLFHRFVGPEAMASGELALGEETGDQRVVRLADVSVPVLVVAGANDGITPVSAVRALIDLLGSSEELRLEIVPGGHLGALTGRSARETTWPVLAEWFDRWAAPVDLDEDDAASPSRSTIGTGRNRRYGSGGSRALTR